MKPMVISMAVVVALATGAEALPRECQEFRGGGFPNNRIERPRIPSCVSMLDADRSQDAHDSCNGELDLYRGALKGYFDCLRAEAAEAADEYGQTIRKFNCEPGGKAC
jgi:hypothetical protein